MNEFCPLCDGTGVDYNHMEDYYDECSWCGGTGVLRKEDNDREDPQ